MLQPRYSSDRGHANHGWLDSFHTFSFAGYQDPEFMGFRVLRVINEDRIEGGQGFATHGHRDMEIISYVIDGALEHADTLGNKTVIQPGEVQRMTAGRGIQHSEYNHRKDRVSHFLQIWILPRERGLEPGYDQKTFTDALAAGGLVLVASPDGRDGSVSLNQDVLIYAAKSRAAADHRLELAPGRHAWIQVVRGPVTVNGLELNAGDGLAVADESELRITAKGECEYLAFDLP